MTQSSEACSRCGCSPTRRRAHPSRPRPPRCPKCSAASATGTTASRGLATRASASARFSAPARKTKPSMFLAWLLHASRLDRPRLPVLLTLHGKHPRAERTLDGWPGYANSQPVRVGNGAADQHQLDGYGWVIDAAWLATRAGQRLSSETWRAIAGFADRVAQRWREPDAGIWEIRDDAQHHVHSKLMAWLALDRALRIAATHRLGDASTPTLGDRTRRDRPRGAEPRIRRSARQLHAQLRIRRARRIPSRASAPRHRTARRAARSRHDRRDPARPRRRRALALPLPARARRPPRHRRRVHALRVLARTGTRQDRTIRRGRGPSRGAHRPRDTTRPVRRRDGTNQRHPPRQLSPGAHPRCARPSGSCARDAEKCRTRECPRRCTAGRRQRV